MSARLLLLVAVALAGPGCALLTKSKPIDLRYFTPEAAVEPGAPPPTTATAPAGLQLRLARINTASYLRDRIAFRDATAEIGYYTSLRWAEPPAAYLRRALARTLFEHQGIAEIVSGAGPTLEVDLDAFEELRAPGHAGRVTVTWRLRGDRTVLVQRTFTIERPIRSGRPADGPGAIAAALASALREAVDVVVAAVVAELARDARPAAATAASP